MHCLHEMVDVYAINNIRKNIYRARYTVLPPLHKNIIHDAIVQTETIRNNNFFTGK